MKFNTTLLWISLLLGISFFMYSCKDPEPPKATIKVLNRFDKNRPVASAVVTVFANAPMGKVDPTIDGDIVKTAVTDGSGRVDFTFEAVSILSVKAELAVSPGDTLFGVGVLRLQEDEVYEETVYLSEHKSQL